MAGKYTYEDFQKALTNSGYSFSNADLRLAQQNPDAGMSILNYKRDYANAATPEARALANQGAERIRSGYGGYTAGADGSGYYLNPISPSSFNAETAVGAKPAFSGTYASTASPSGFSAGAAPAFSSAYTQDVADLWDAVKNYGSFDYSNKNLYQQALDKAVNRDPFRYDAATDPLYSQYRKEYTREGNRAMEDTLGAAAAMSGGRASSWANTAAAQARNYYAAQMTDKIPELYQLALQKYLAEAQMNQSGLSAMQADRAAEQSEWRGNYDVLASKAGMAQGLENTDYSRYLDSLNQWNTDRNFSYGQLLDEIANQQALDQTAYERRRTAEQDALDRAVTFANTFGDYDAGDALGANTDFARERQRAELEALNPMELYARMQSEGVNDPGTAALWLAARGYSDNIATQYAGAYTTWLAQQNAGEQVMTPADILNYWFNYGVTGGAAAAETPARTGGTGYSAYLPAPKTPRTDGKQQSAGTAQSLGANYSSIWNNTRRMYDNGASETKIMNYLDGQSTKNLTDAGLKNIMTSLNLGGYRG